MTFFEKLISFTAAHRILAHLAFWLGMFIISISRDSYYDNEDPFWHYALAHSVYISFSVIAAYFMSYRVIPRLFDSRKYYSVILYFLAGSYLITTVARFTVIYGLEPIIRKPPFEQESIGEILTDIPKLVVSYFFSIFSPAMVFVLLKLIKDQYQVKEQALSLEKEKVEAELRMLKTQLNPHFLFNTLNNIYSLSLLNSPKTSKSIAGLSTILDHILYRCNQLYAPLSAEISLLENYITLEQLRYDERLKINFKSSTDREAHIAPLILLSLVENAFKHGAGEDIDTPQIDIELKLKNDQFRFRVANAYVPQERWEAARDSIGLNNIRKQLALVYPGKHDFKVTKQEHIFVAELFLEL